MRSEACECCGDTDHPEIQGDPDCAKCGGTGVVCMEPNFRLALRHEGEFWNCYLAPRETMVGAILMGSIRMRVVQQSIAIKHAFEELMQTSLTVAVQNTANFTINWPNAPIAAPESERSGNA